MGRIGLVHLEAITKAPGVTPVMVSNPTVSKAEAAAKQYNVPRFTNDAMEVITDPDGTNLYVKNTFESIFMFLIFYIMNVVEFSRCRLDLQSFLLPRRTNQGLCCQ
jgi:hypothetical protein